jgi:thiamine biosynthesis lipoprotein
MKETRTIMGMPIELKITDLAVTPATSKIFEKIFSYFTYVDETFSTYKDESEISRINRGLISEEAYSEDMREIFVLAATTKAETKGYFDIVTPDGAYDPSGIVKGWAIKRATELIEEEGYKNFYIEAGGDIQSRGVNEAGMAWQVGIRNPFNVGEIIKVLSVSGEGVATSGTYLRGQHIYDPHMKKAVGEDIVSLTVVGRDIYEADRFATAAFAMGASGIRFIEELPGFEGYMVDAKGMGTMTRGFSRFVSATNVHA